MAGAEGAFDQAIGPAEVAGLIPRRVVDLFKDGVNGPTDSSAEFRVQAKSATSYDVRVYVGAFGFELDNVKVTVEGQPTVTAAATNWDQMTTVTVLGGTDTNADGFISVTFADWGDEG